MTRSSFPMLCCAGPRDKEMASLGSLPSGAPSQSQGTGQTRAGARARPGSPEKPGEGGVPQPGHQSYTSRGRQDLRGVLEDSYELRG